MSDILWLPTNTSAKDLLCLDVNEFADFDATMQINQAMVNWLNGELDTGTLTDMMLQNDVNPDILNDCESYVQALLK